MITSAAVGRIDSRKVEGGGIIVGAIWIMAMIHMIPPNVARFPNYCYNIWLMRNAEFRYDIYVVFLLYAPNYYTTRLSSYDVQTLYFCLIIILMRQHCLLDDLES